jgi:hypothetical protein
MDAQNITELSTITNRVHSWITPISIKFRDSRICTELNSRIINLLYIYVLEINTRGHEYEKGYRIKNVVTLFWWQFPGKQQCWCQIWPRKSGIHVHTTHVWKVWCKSGQNFVFKFWPLIPMTLTLTKFDLTKMNPSRTIPGSAYTPYQVLWNGPSR